MMLANDQETTAKADAERAKRGTICGCNNWNFDVNDQPDAPKHAGHHPYCGGDGWNVTEYGEIPDKPKTDQENREAKRIACIAESMNIIRTLNSHEKDFMLTTYNNKADEKSGIVIQVYDAAYEFMTQFVNDQSHFDFTGVNGRPDMWKMMAYWK
jgi:hypothetical protein